MKNLGGVHLPCTSDDTPDCPPNFTPKRIRIWCEYDEDGRWYIDGYDPELRICSNVIWDEDTFSQIIARIPEFTERPKEIYAK